MRPLLLLPLFTFLLACSSDETSAPAGASGASGASGTSGQGGQAGAGPVGGSGPGGSAGSGGQAGASCASFPAPRLGTDPAAQALAAAPARCGQPAFSWLDDASLGEVKSSTPGATYKVSLLTGLVQGLIGDKVPPPAHDVSTFRFVYTTQDRGKLVEATAAVALPSAPLDGPIPLVAVLHGTSGFTDGCGPSKDSDSVALLAYIASLGYIAVGPDYLGLRGDDGKTGFPHPYLAGHPTALASLDALRAAGRLAQTRQLCPSPAAVVVGGSQGGHAALWVDRLAPYYAPEIDLRGVVATVPPAALLAEAERALTSLVPASSNSAAMFGVTSAWYGHGAELAQVFVPPKDTEIPAALAASCDPGDAVDQVTSLESVFQPALLDAAKNKQLAQQQPFGCLVAENDLITTSVARLPTPSPSYGILYVLGEKDELVHTPIERDAFAALCQQGVPLTYLECAGASHTKATTWALPEILEFARARHAGEAFTPACTVAPPTTCQATPPPSP